MSGNKNKRRREKAKTIALSFVIAIIAWATIMWVDNPDITTTVTDLQVMFRGEELLREKGLVITNKSSIPGMSVAISGKRSDLMDFMDGIYVEVDTSEITEAGEYVLSGVTALPSTRLTVEKEKFGDVTVNVEKLASKEIEIRIKQTGTLKDKIVESVPEVSHVVISGAQSEVEKVEYGLASIDISSIPANRVIPSTYTLMDAEDNFVDKHETVEAEQATIRVKNVVYTARTLPVTPELSSELGNEYTLDLEKTTVSPASITAGVLGDDADTEIKAYIENIGADGYADCMIVAPEGIYIPEESRTVRVKVVTEKITTGHYAGDAQ